MENFPWGFVVIGGPAILLFVIVYGYLRGAKRDKEIDPNTPGDDPSKGMM